MSNVVLHDYGYGWHYGRIESVLDDGRVLVKCNGTVRVVEPHNVRVPSSDTERAAAEDIRLRGEHR
jgi:hypothetical protein